MIIANFRFSFSLLNFSTINEQLEFFETTYQRSQNVQLITYQLQLSIKNEKAFLAPFFDFIYCVFRYRSFRQQRICRRFIVSTSKNRPCKSGWIYINLGREKVSKIWGAVHFFPGETNDYTPFLEAWSERSITEKISYLNFWKEASKTKNWLKSYYKKEFNFSEPQAEKYANDYVKPQ